MACISGAQSMGDAFGPGYDTSLDGGQFGFDHQLASGLVLGVTFGYASADTHDAQAGRTSLENRSGGVYGHYEGGGFATSVLAMYGNNDYTTSRTTPAGPRPQTTAQAAANGRGYSAGGRFEYTGAPEAHHIVHPYAEVLYDHIDGATFAEYGAGDADLLVRTHAMQGLQVTAGIAVGGTYDLAGFAVRPALQVGVTQEFLDTHSVFDASLLSAAGSNPFQGDGGHSDRTSFTTELDLEFPLGPRSSFSLGYAGDFAGDRSQNEINATLSVVW